nr:hypothetical protein [Psychrobacter sp. PraFG1]UNK05931.1 hypothetical protein MN210_04095 [Psychrobacter sp. PraFG1]
MNKQAMGLHMEEISKAVPEGRHAVVVMDGALWHQPSLDKDNVTMLKLPPTHLNLTLLNRYGSTLNSIGYLIAVLRVMM